MTNTDTSNPVLRLLDSIQYIVCDYNGTLAVDGSLKESVAPLFNALSVKGYQIFVITADTHGDAQKNLSGLPCKVEILSSAQHDEEKRDFITKLGSDKCIAFGNGRNDRLMLKEAALGIAVLQEEGLHVETLNAADIVVKDISDGLNLLLNPKRLIATLRL